MHCRTTKMGFPTCKIELSNFTVSQWNQIQMKIMESIKAAGLTQK